MSRPPFASSVETAADSAVRSGDIYTEVVDEETLVAGDSGGFAISTPSDHFALQGVYVHIHGAVAPDDVTTFVTIDEVIGSSTGRIRLGGTAADSFDFSQPLDIRPDETVHVEIDNQTGQDITFDISMLYRGNE